MNIREPIPDEALDDRLAFVGTSGSGKTFAAKGRIEKLLKMGHRVVIIDPLDVWFGLRLGLDGHTPAYDVAIFGGKHADLPLNEHAGAIIGEAIATSSESCILSLASLRTSASRQRFMLAFLDALYECTDPDKQEPYHVVFDEADLWAPQKPIGAEAMLCHLMEEIVRRGRVKGFIPWLISQRPAVLNKNVLSQADGLVAMSLTSSQDRDAIGAWIEGQADRKDMAKVLADLPTLQRGHGVVWMPRHGILGTVAFPPNRTFDSSRTPKRGEKKINTVIAPLNIDALRAKLSTVEVEAKANDPAELKKTIADLRPQLQEAQGRHETATAPGAPIEPDQGMLDAEYRRGFAEGEEQGRQVGLRPLKAARPPLADLLVHLEAAASFAADIERLMEQPVREIATLRTPVAAPRPMREAPAALASPMAIREIDLHPPCPPLPEGLLAPAPCANSSLKPALQKVIDAVGWWRKIGVEPVRRDRACVAAGYSPRASTFGVYIGELVKQGLIETPPGHLKLTRAGLAAARIPAATSPEDLYRVARGMLKPQEARVFDVIYRAFPREIARSRVAEIVGLSPTASTLGVYIGGVAAYGIVEASSPGHVRAADWLFPGGR